MELKYYSITASLVRCSNSDFYDSHGRLFENKTFYIQDEATYKFLDRYFVGDIYYNSVEESTYKQTEDYYRKQITYLKNRNLIYKLHEAKELEFNFKLYLQTALLEDIFYSETKYLRVNTTYYTISEKNQILGPFTIVENNLPQNFERFLEKGFLLRPTKKQSFETIKSAIAL